MAFGSGLYTRDKVMDIKCLQEKVNYFGDLIKAPNNKLILNTSRTDNGRFHIEINDNEYHYVVTDLGAEVERRITKDEDEILYWIFRKITSSLAISYELENRKEGCDFRRIKFDHQLKLLGEINKNWESRMKNEINEILIKSPFTD